MDLLFTSFLVENRRGPCPLAIKSKAVKPYALETMHPLDVITTRGLAVRCA